MINNTGNINRPQNSTFLSPHVTQPSNSLASSPWRANPPTTTPGPNVPTTGIRLPSIPPGVSPAIATTSAATTEANVNLPPQTMNPQVNPPPVTAPSAPPSEKAPSPPKPVTPPLPRTLSPTIVTKLQNMKQTLGKPDLELLAMVKNAKPEVLQTEFGELEQLEEDTESELLPQETAIRAQYSKEFNECTEEFENAIKDEEETKKLLEEALLQKQSHQKKIESLNREEHEIPQTSQLPAEILVEQIEFENKINLEAKDIKRLSFRAEYAETDDEDFVEMDFDDEEMMVQDENLIGVVKRPDYYVAEDIYDFESQREKYWPLIKSLAYAMEEFNFDTEETIESNHDRFFSYSQVWKSKQERADRNTKKIHRDNLKRELYERTFPDIKRAREEKERAARSEKRPNAKQEAAMAKAKGDRRKKVFGSAVIPPMKRTPMMNDKPKGRVMDDPMYEAQHSLLTFLVSWTEREKAMYQKHFLRFGKNFSAISACLGTKSTEECIRYFYLTKQHVKYKQLHRMKRKKAGKAYKPNPHPTEGERNSERIKHFPYMRTNKYTECLICERQMFCYLVQKYVKGIPVPGEFVETIQSKLPICDPCNNHIRKARAANYSKCPLVGCSLGRRRTKPNRTIPETANKLDVEKRQYIIHRRKLHPDAVKCCGSCIRKIQNDFADLAAGKLDDQIKEFAQARAEKKRKKESEHIPVWKEWEVWRLRDAILTFGISNWYEVASKLGRRDKTPYWCYMKYKEICADGTWESMDKDYRPIEPYESEAPMQEEAVDYLFDIIDSHELQKEAQMADSGVQIKQEVITPADSPQMVIAEEEQNGFIEVNYDENENFEDLMDENFTRRERRIMRHDFLQEIAEFREQNPEIPVEMSSECKEEPMEIVENHVNEASPSVIDDDDEIQIIEVIPPPQRQFFGSLTQGTPRAAPLVPDHFSLPSTSLSNNINHIGIVPSFMSSEERFRAFNNDTLKTLLQRPSTNSTTSNFNNVNDDLSLLFSNVVNSVPPMPSSRGPSSVTSVTPVDTPIATSVDVVNFFLPEPENNQQKTSFSKTSSPAEAKSPLETAVEEETAKLDEKEPAVQQSPKKDDAETVEKPKTPTPKPEPEKEAQLVENEELEAAETSDEEEEVERESPVIIDVPPPTGLTPPPEVDLTTLSLSELINTIVNTTPLPINPLFEIARRRNVYEREQAERKRIMREGGGNLEQFTSAQNSNQRVHTPPVTEEFEKAYLEAKRRQALQQSQAAAQPAPIPSVSSEQNSSDSDRSRSVDPVKRKSGVSNTMLPHTHTTYKNAMHIRIPHSNVPSEHSSESGSTKNEQREERATSQDAIQGLLKLMSPVTEDQLPKKQIQEPESVEESPQEEEITMEVDTPEKTPETLSEIQEPDSIVAEEEEIQEIESLEIDESEDFQGDWPTYERGTTPYSDIVIGRSIEYCERPLSAGDKPKNHDDIYYANFETDENNDFLEEHLGIGDSALSPPEHEVENNDMDISTTEKLNNVAHFREEIPQVPDLDNQVATYPAETPEEIDYEQLEGMDQILPISRNSEDDNEEPRQTFYDEEAWRQQTAYAEALQLAQEQALLEEAEEEREYLERKAQELVLEEAPMTVAEKIASMITKSANINPEDIEIPEDIPINHELNLDDIDEDELEMDLRLNDYIRDENLDYNLIDPAYFAQLPPLEPLQLDCVPAYQFPLQEDDSNQEVLARIRRHANRFLGAPIVDSLRPTLLVPKRKRKKTKSRKRRHDDVIFNDPWDPSGTANKRRRLQNDENNVLEPRPGPSGVAPARLQNIPEEENQIAAGPSNQNIVQEENDEDRIFRFDAGYLNRTFGIQPQNQQVQPANLPEARAPSPVRPDVLEEDFTDGEREESPVREPILLGNHRWRGGPLRTRSPFLRRVIVKRKNGLMKDLIHPEIPSARNNRT
uniref:SANT domain-containing protein n=1 Tax=Panagrolaimus sp. JU765 TaxID=591449 RepID=A0AC34QBR5_9BILA